MNAEPLRVYFMSKWHGRPYKGQPGPPPTEAEISHLEQFLESPATQVEFNRIRRARPKQDIAA